jgi:hypothetical protein
MDYLEKQGWKRHGSVRYEYKDGKRIPFYEGKVSTRAKAAVKRSYRNRGQDVRFTKVGPGEWAPWTKDLPANDLLKFKPRYEQATRYKMDRSRGNVSIPAYDIKMKKYKKKFVPVDPQIRKIMKKEKAYVDATGKRIVLPRKQLTLDRKRPVHHKTHKPHKSKYLYVWPFSLMPRKRK